MYVESQPQHTGVFQTPLPVHLLLMYISSITPLLPASYGAAMFGRAPTIVLAAITYNATTLHRNIVPLAAAADNADQEIHGRRASSYKPPVRLRNEDPRAHRSSPLYLIQVYHYKP